MESRRLLSLSGVLDAGVLLKDGTNDLAVQWDSTPCTGDWNGDGKKDLIVGQYTSGYIWLYTNTGSDAAPSFAGRTTMTAAGQQITTSYG